MGCLWHWTRDLFALRRPLPGPEQSMERNSWGPLYETLNISNLVSFILMDEKVWMKLSVRLGRAKGPLIMPLLLWVLYSSPLILTVTISWYLSAATLSSIFRFCYLQVSREPLPPEGMNDIFEDVKDMGVLIGKGGIYGQVKHPPSTFILSISLLN